MVQTPKLNLTELFANSQTSGNLSININKEGENVVVNIHSTITDNSNLPLNSNINTNGRYVFDGTPEIIGMKIADDLGLDAFVTI